MEKVSPAAQGVQEEAAPAAAVLPAAQSVQTRLAVALPGCDARTTEPAAHVVHASQAVAPAAAAKVPLAQGWHAGELAAAEKEPAAHGLQTASLVAVPGVCTKEPGGHRVKGVQVAAPGPGAKPPAPQGAHALAPPADAVPAAQTAHAEFAVVLHARVWPEPAAQVSQSKHGPKPVAL